MKEFTKWTRKEFEALPTPKSYTNEEIGEVDSLVILPEKHNHDSGWRCMSFVTIQNGVPTYRISGCSDVINLGGIGGYNFQGMSDCVSTDRIKSQVVMSRLFQCGNCDRGKYTFTVESDEDKVPCPKCGKDNYLCEIKKGKL